MGPSDRLDGLLAVFLMVIMVVGSVVLLTGTIKVLCWMRNQVVVHHHTRTGGASGLGTFLLGGVMVAGPPVLADHLALPKVVSVAHDMVRLGIVIGLALIVTVVVSRIAKQAVVARRRSRKVLVADAGYRDPVSPARAGVGAAEVLLTQARASADPDETAGYLARANELMRTNGITKADLDNAAVTAEKNKIIADQVRRHETVFPARLGKLEES